MIKRMLLKQLGSLNFKRSEQIDLSSNKSSSSKSGKNNSTLHFVSFLRILCLLLIMLCGISNRGYSYVGNWYSQGTADASVPGNWNSAVNGTGTIAVAADFTTAGNTWNVQSTMSLSASWTVTGSVAITATGSLSPGANNIALGGSWTNNGSFTCGTGTVTFNATTAGNTLNGNMTGSNQFNNVTFINAAGAWSFGANSADVGGNFTITSGTVTAPSTILQVAGNFVHTAGTFTHNSGTVTLNGIGVQTIPTTATTFNNLTISNTGAPISANGAITVINALSSVSGSTMNMLTFQLLNGGSLNPTNFNGTLQTQYSPGAPIPTGLTWGGTVTYNSPTTAMSISQGTYNNLTISGTSGARTFSAGNTVVNGNFNVGTAATTTGITTLGGNLTVGGNVTIGSSTTASIFDVSAGNYQVTVGGNWSQYSTAATIPFNIGRVGLVVFNGTGPQSIATTGGTSTVGFYNFENSNTSNTVSINSNTVITGNMTNDLGATLNAGSATLSVGSNWANNGAFTCGTSTVIMNSSTSGKTLTGNMTGSNMFNNITFTMGGVWSFGANAADVGGNLTLGTGTLTAPSTTLNIGGNFAHTGGTFNHNSGTIGFNGTGAQTLPGSAVTTFYNVNISNTGGTVTANGPFTINGTLSSSTGANLNMATYQYANV